MVTTYPHGKSPAQMREARLRYNAALRAWVAKQGWGKARQTFPEISRAERAALRKREV